MTQHSHENAAFHSVSRSLSHSHSLSISLSFPRAYFPKLSRPGFSHSHPYQEVRRGKVGCLAAVDSL